MISRTLLCDECSFQWKEFASSSSAPIPECPVCAAVAKRIPGPFAITGSASRAIDFAQRIAEEQFGMTDMADNQRAGDVAAVPPPPVQSAEAEKIVREMVAAGASEQSAPALVDAAKRFWQGGAGGMPQMDTATALAAGAPAALAARAEGVDPLGLLHDAGKRGLMDISVNVVGRAKLEGGSVGEDSRVKPSAVGEGTD